MWILRAIMIGLFANLLFGGHHGHAIMDGDFDGDCNPEGDDCYGYDVDTDETN